MAINHKLKQMAFILVLVTNISSAALTIPPKPLFLANDVQANIFFALDDSGSMDSEVLNTDDANNTLISLIPFNSVFQAILNQSDIRDIDLSPDGFNEDLDLCSAYNLMAYDPTQTYTPWQGKDIFGQPYSNQSITNALNNPFNPNEGSTNLLNIFDQRTGRFSNRPAWYSTFTDNGLCNTSLFWDNGFNSLSQARNNDGKMQLCECLSAPAGVGFGVNYRVRFDFIANDGDPRFFRVDNLTDAEQTNYANWFTYYRKREYVMKRALSQLITTSQARMGLATLQNNLGVGTPVSDMTDQSNKDNLLSRLFQIFPSGLTPLRTTLRNVGRYFDQNDGASHASLGFDNASPILPQSEGGECQQNFTVLFSDGFWNGNNPGDIFNEDGDNNTSFDGGPHADSVSKTLADVAMKYYEKDLSPLANNVPTITGIDENSAQHMVTYTISYGLNGSLSAVPANRNPGTPPPPWPTPFANTLTTVDDMRHAAFNARGLYLPGQNPQQLIDTLTAALADIGSRTGAASAAASTSQSVKSNALIFQGTFNSEDWSGTFSAFPLSTEGVLGAAQWEASTLIPQASQRSLYSFNKNGTPPEGIEFTTSSISASQKSIIGAEADKIIGYIRGIQVPSSSQAGEVKNGGSFRNRNTLLGDIVHSTPVAVTRNQASPPFNKLPGIEGESYQAFQGTKSGILETVFVGSNNGILHAFDANTGEEVMGYIPEGIFNKLSILTDTTYDHAFFVDGVLAAGDVFINGGWKTVLIGTLGRGGNTIFAIDVTDMSSFDETKILWEFTHPELGIVLGKPQIVRLLNGKWSVVVGNGYNSLSEKPELLIIDIETGNLTKKITAGNEILAGNNGLSTPLVVDTNGDFISDLIYAGDLKGNLWKFNLNSSSVDSWNTEFANSPLYTALAPSGVTQPITSKPVIAKHPEGGFMVVFGTGKFFTQGDEIIPSEGPDINTFYGIRDLGSPVPSVGSRNLPPNTQPDLVLQPQSIVTEEVEVSAGVTNTIRIISNNPLDFTGGGGKAPQQGWYMDLISPINGAEGERVIADPQLRNVNSSTSVLFNTFVPGGSCESIGGFSALMVFDAITGSRTSFSVFDLNNDGEVTDNDKESSSGFAVNGRINRQSVSAVTVVSSGDATESFVVESSTQSVSPSISTVAGATISLGRQSWRQLQ